MIANFLALSLISRMILAFFLSFFFSLLFGKTLIVTLKKKGMVDYFRIDSPSSHQSKKGTPTGGGLLILLCLGISFLLFGKDYNEYVLLALFTIFYLGGVGLLDDVLKKFRKSSQGLSGKIKLLFQTALSFFVAFYIYYFEKTSTSLQIPFLNFHLDLHFAYIFLVISIILGSSNAVNLTDGLDGLVAGCMIGPAIIFILLGYLQENVIFSFPSFLFTRTFASGELAFIWSALLGSILGFLWYNRYPAKMFMGGVGSEALGGALGISVILLKVELFLLIFGGVFVAEALSVILQVISYKTRGKRIFKMTPLHHHFELSGMDEPKIVAGFWTVSAILSGIALVGLFIS